jgi:hypothetical protein
MGLATIAGTGCPPPEPDPCDCSPGYWKNHFDFWKQAVLDDGEDPGEILLQLQAKGGANSGRPVREGAASYLNGLDLEPEC